MKQYSPWYRNGLGTLKVLLYEQEKIFFDLGYFLDLRDKIDIIGNQENDLFKRLIVDLYEKMYGIKR